MTKELERVARRISREVGIPLDTSRRIAKKLNLLAREVDWAEPVDGSESRISVNARRQRKSRSSKLAFTVNKKTSRRTSEQKV